MEYLAFIEHQKHIEADWNATFGDRKNEIVFIGIGIDEATMRNELDSCLSKDDELETQKWKNGYEDQWHAQKAYTLYKLEYQDLLNSSTTALYLLYIKK